MAQDTQHSCESREGSSYQVASIRGKSARRTSKTAPAHLPETQQITRRNACHRKRLANI